MRLTASQLAAHRQGFHDGDTFGSALQRAGQLARLFDARHERASYLRGFLEAAARSLDVDPAKMIGLLLEHAGEHLDAPALELLEEVAREMLGHTPPPMRAPVATVAHLPGPPCAACGAEIALTDFLARPPAGDGGAMSFFHLDCARAAGLVVP